MKKFVYNIIFPISFLAVLLWSVIGVSMDRGFYARQYAENATHQKIGIAYDDLMQVTDNLLDYMVCRRDDLEMQYEVKGEMREIFGKREKIHMIDVRRLYMGAVCTAATLAVLSIAAAIWLVRSDGGVKAREIMRKKYKNTMIGLVVVIAALGVIFFVDFDTFWRTFHKIFFTNSLWILDPRESIMINMFPLEFFLAMCVRIVCVFVFVCICVIDSLIWEKPYQAAKRLKNKFMKG